MRPYLKRALSVHEVRAMERFADSAGKHAGQKREPHIERDRWVLIQAPVLRLNTIFDDSEYLPSAAATRRILEYRDRPAATAPPVRLGFGAFSARRGARDAYVKNGNHRVLAARMRGDESVEAIMPAEDFERWLSVF